MFAEVVDLTDSAASREWVDGAAERAGGFDILYNNAAASRTGPLLSTSEEDWDFTLRNEIDLVYYCCRYAWPHLVARGAASIINTASVIAVRASAAGGVPHAAGKGAVLAFTRQLALEGAPHGIRANAISPGLIETPGIAYLLADERMRTEVLGRQLLDFVGQPDDVANLALFLASTEARFITGINVVIDGGASISVG
jgi:NAD(P)-dependent dehydrogenase (short-subunit alcohol dehydrogenase family)